MKRILEITIMALSRINFYEVLQAYDKIKASYEFSYEAFRYLSNRTMHELTNDDLYNIYENIKTRVADEKEYLRYTPSDTAIETGLNVFDLLLITANYFLDELNGEPVCRYDNILLWRMASLSLDEDLFITAFFAYRDIINPFNRKNFYWKPVISHNNSVLQTILERGVAENHFHLLGSAQFFQLSWINIMNHIESGRFRSALDRIGKNRLNHEFVYADDPNDSLWLRCYKAAIIRLYLFMDLEPCFKLKDESFIGCFDDIYNILKSNESIDIVNFPAIDSITDGIRMVNGSYDYAMSLVVYDNDLNEYYAGERALFYKLMQKIFKNEQECGTTALLLHVYILLKESIRSELIQVNDVYGFDNFRLYQDRKIDFVENTPVEPIFYRTAIRDTLMNQRSIKKLEVRISPWDSAAGMYYYIKSIDRCIDNPEHEDEEKLSDKYFYTLHFIKRRDDSISIHASDLCRHSRLRRLIKRQAFSIMKLRTNCPDLVHRIKGIDAASSEIGCRPEVFAHAFRVLREHEVKLFGAESILPRMKVTYHVGEDYADVIDGLRAIDEALSFLNMHCGDRIGHAIVLGIDAHEWYNNRNNTIMITQQDYLDNIAWLYSKIIEYRLNVDSSVMFYLQNEFQKYFRIVYRDNIHSDAFKGAMSSAYYQDRLSTEFNINTYYNAWTLRGDDPEKYRTGQYKTMYYTDIWEWNSVNNKFPVDKSIRKSAAISFLYYSYHYNADIKIEGNKSIKISVPHNVIDAVDLVRDKLQRIIAYKGLCIETNPSSNCMIGPFDKYSYEKHPILNFYNIGLETSDGKSKKNCNNISVCINTDDQSVFKTSLENEYAFIVRALECDKNIDGGDKYGRSSIYNWIDNIRQMGMDFSFDK